MGHDVLDGINNVFKRISLCRYNRVVLNCTQARPHVVLRYVHSLYSATPTFKSVCVGASGATADGPPQHSHTECIILLTLYVYHH